VAGDLSTYRGCCKCCKVAHEGGGLPGQVPGRYLDSCKKTRLTWTATGVGSGPRQPQRGVEALLVVGVSRHVPGQIVYLDAYLDSARPYFSRVKRILSSCPSKTPIKEFEI
jgi:hypothetical protein